MPAVLLLAVVAAVAAEPRVPHATAEMAALLRQQAALVNRRQLGFAVNDERAELLAQELKQQPPSMERLQLRFLFARELLNAGREADALRAIEALQADLPHYLPAGSPQMAEALILKAMTHLRIAERENCGDHNNRDSCLWPIRGAGIHHRKEGARLAAQTLMELLGTFPEHLGGQWLLNVAHMTLGSHPDGVPRRYLIPPEAFASAYPLPRFDNIAREVGLDIFSLAGGGNIEDYDGDGLFDVVVSSTALDGQMRLFRNVGDGSFEERTAAAGLIGEVGGLNMTHADYDNDGRVDILVLRGGWMGSEGRFPMSLLRNEGNGTFADVTTAAGLLRLAPTQTAAWLDYDGDGDLDLFVGNESVADHPYACELYRNEGDGTFVNVAKDAGLDFVGFVKGVASGDYDNDGRPDLFLSVTRGNNVLFRNEGPGADGRSWRFKNVTAPAGVAEPFLSFGTFFFDYDNDGWEDLFVVGYTSFHGTEMAENVAADYLGLPTEADRGRLYRNRGDGTFEDVTRAAGLWNIVPAMGVNFGDLDNDGFLDIYFGTGNTELSTLVPNRMFRNDGGRVFQDVTTAGNSGHLQKGHGIAFADLDNDGDQDVFEQMGGANTADLAYSALYENPGNTNGWIGLDLEGTASNRKAIGARVKITADQPGGPRSFHRTVGSGASFGASPFAQHVGLGEARGPVAVEVRWPATGKTQVFESLEPGRWYRLREGAEAAHPLERRRFTLRRNERRAAP